VRPFHDPAPEDVAVLTYTSGTTGPAKAAILTHATLACQAASAPDWLGLGAGDRVLTTEPFSHATGLGLHLALALANGLPLVMTYRFEPRHTLALIEHYTPAFTAGTVPCFVALAEEAGQDERARTALSRMTTVVTGGSPLPAAMVDSYENRFGVYLRNAYGLTETASVCIAVPPGERAPIDPGSGAVSVGRPVPGVTVSIVMDNGGAAPPGVGGEIVVQGPQVATGYWNRPDYTASTFGPDGLHTGDVGFVDDRGWVYLVDRQQDLIVVSGYKVWPRDVEDVLCQHPSVAEAAVIGIPDDARGQTVIAFVVPRPDARLVVEDLHRLCRAHLSAYKCPRQYEVVPTLPKSASGTVLRRSLRVGA
jgi:long-chain acyl-CoA synthetase